MEYGCSKGDHTVVKHLLYHKADPNKPLNVFSTPLSLASEKGHIKIVKLLIDYKAKVDSDCYRDTALHTACLESNIEIVEYLIKCKADVNRINRFGDSILAIQGGCGVRDSNKKYDIMKILLENKANVNYYNPHNLGHALEASITQENKIVKLLLDFKADPNSIGKNGRSALFRVSESLHSSLYSGSGQQTINNEKQNIRELCNKGATLNNLDKLTASKFDYNFYWLSLNN